MIRQDWSTLKKLMFMKTAAGGGAAVEDTATGNPLTFLTDLARPLKSLLIPFTPVQSGSGDPSPQNIRSIIPWDGLTVKQGGKNLLNVDRTEASPNPTDISNTTSPRVMDTSHYFVGIRSDNYYYKNYVVLATVVNGTISIQSTNNNDYGIGFPVAVKGGQKYTLSAVAEQGFLVSFGYYDSEWHYLSGTSFYNLSPATVTVPDGAYYMVIVFRSTLDTTFTYSDIQLEVGQTATAYEPYKPITETDISFPSPVYGGTLDVVSGVLTVEYVGESKRLSDYWSKTVGETHTEYTLLPFFADSIKRNSNQKCNVAPYAWAGNNGTTHFYASEADGRVYVYLPNETDETLEIVCVAELATPQETTLTPEQITAIKGDNTIWSDANGLLLATFLKKG